ncbi:MAG: hypothetical protein LBS74_10735 [Oscillospiraceae bacterium]|jgi:hypothetical protein|nr:hypothetical protein [Oscillospiraceae bacterium]
MKIKAFGKNVDPSCQYCEFNSSSDESVLCQKNRAAKNGKCSKYKYNPLKRKPNVVPVLPSFKKTDFEL